MSNINNRHLAAGVLTAKPWTPVY